MDKAGKGKQGNTISIHFGIFQILMVKSAGRWYNNIIEQQTENVNSSSIL